MIRMDKYKCKCCDETKYFQLLPIGIECTNCKNLVFTRLRKSPIDINVAMGRVYITIDITDLNNE